jgi:ribonuclease P protein component
VTRLTLPGGSRLRRHRDVRRPLDHGRSGGSGGVVVYAFGRGDAEPPRYALVVGRRWGDAVTRNRVRRLLRESFRTARPDLAPGFDFVLLPRAPLARRRMQEVRDELVRAARTAVRRFREEGPGVPREGPRQEGRTPAPGGASGATSP